jgi:hypothetical protein
MVMAAGGMLIALATALVTDYDRHAFGKQQGQLRALEDEPTRPSHVDELALLDTYRERQEKHMETIGNMTCDPHSGAQGWGECVAVHDDQAKGKPRVLCKCAATQ